MVSVKSRRFAFVGIPAAVGIAVAVIVILQPSSSPTVNIPNDPLAAYTLDFPYETVNSDLKSTLITKGINMSSPIRMSQPDEINLHCNFLSNQTKQAMIEYCTSTEIKDEHGNFLGNLDMVGSPLAPVLVIATGLSDPMFANYKDVKTVFSDVMNETVCQCWAKEKPGGYATLSDMMDALREFHLKGKEPNSTTHGIPLAGKHFEIELTTNAQGYLWKLLVAK